MHHLAVADVHADVADRAVEEEQVAGLQLGRGTRDRPSSTACARVRQADAGGRVGVLRQPRAVEGVRARRRPTRRGRRSGPWPCSPRSAPRRCRPPSAAAGRGRRPAAALRLPGRGRRSAAAACGAGCGRPLRPLPAPGRRGCVPRVPLGRGPRGRLLLAACSRSYCGLVDGDLRVEVLLLRGHPVDLGLRARRRAARPRPGPGRRRRWPARAPPRTPLLCSAIACSVPTRSSRSSADSLVSIAWSEPSRSPVQALRATARTWSRASARSAWAAATCVGGPCRRLLRSPAAARAPR